MLVDNGSARILLIFISMIKWLGEKNMCQDTNQGKNVRLTYFHIIQQDAVIICQFNWIIRSFSLFIRRRSSSGTWAPVGVMSSRKNMLFFLIVSLVYFANSIVNLTDNWTVYLTVNTDDPLNLVTDSEFDWHIGEFFGWEFFTNGMMTLVFEWKTKSI